MTTYAADHVGSFLRPPALVEARLAQAEGQAILAILDVYSDGEYRRGIWR